MIEFLYNIDVQVFFFINKTIANPVTDYVMPFITSLNNWKIFFAIMWLYLVIAGGRKGRVVAIGLILLIAVSDQLSSHLIKNIFDRVRPCNALDDVRMLVNKTTSYSFPSSHAVNHFAGVVFLSHFYKRFSIGFYTAATLIALSRIFCGVHYPSDILGGALIGITVGMIFIAVWDAINKKFKIL
jgi:undecaprenyl-diphosphatase